MYRIKSTKIRSVVLAMAVTLVASASFQISSYRNARRMELISTRDAHVRDVLAALASLRSAVQQAIIAQRGYLLSPEPQDLESYRSAAGNVPAMLAQVRELTADDPVQSAYARDLQPLIEAKLKDLDRAIHELPQPALRPVPQPDIIAAPNARPDPIDQFLGRMTNEEQRLRTECLAQTQAAASAQARALVAASVYRVFVLLAGCTLILLQQGRQRRTEQLCRQSEELFRSAFAHTATGMALADESGRWVKVNRALCEMVGYAPDELLRRGSRSITHPDDLEKERAALGGLTAGRADSHQLELRFMHIDGRIVWALVTHSLVRDERGRPQTFISHIQDITQRKQAEDRLRHQSLHDALTGLPNRLLLVERIQRGIERARQEPDYRLAVLFLDLDRFKLINDSLGHAAGDKLLITVAQRLGQCVRAGDAVGGGEGAAGNSIDTNSAAGRHTVARLAGDEFTVLLEGLRSPADAQAVAERILRELARPIELGGREVSTSASVGLVHGDARRYESAWELLADADAALYRAKADGRGRYVVFDGDMRQSTLQRLRLTAELRQACERGQFVLHYQPIVSLLDRSVAGFDARVRWEHPERGLLEPEQFLDAAEEAGVIVPLGKWALREACRQLAEWRGSSARPSQSHSQSEPSASPDLFVVLPLLREQLAEPELLRLVRDLQHRHPGALSDGGLRVTIGEPVLMHHPEIVNGPLKELRSAGVRVWVGNFGAGITSLSCLRSAGLDGLTIDGRIVSAAAGRRDCAAVVHSLLELARNLRLQVVAEGLETPAQVAMLQAMACPLGQGLFFAPPVPAADAGNLLAGRTLTAPARSA